MHLYLVHHGEAVGANVDPRRPLSPEGAATVERTAREAAARGVKPAVVWHSGKLRARQTAEAFWRACNALAEFCATRDLQPEDPPAWMRDRLLAEERDIMIAGHYPHLPILRNLLLANGDGSWLEFPINGMVALKTDDGGQTWKELWILEAIRTDR